MAGTPVIGPAVPSQVLLVGQAPGIHEAEAGRPFAWTAGKTLFKWFASIGLSEARVRDTIYFSAVCRCFPGRVANREDGGKGGDRVPSAVEIERCGAWLWSEVEALRPRLIIPVGKLAISRFVACRSLDEVIGRRLHSARHRADLIALPHPSGVSTWVHRDPGKTLLANALELLASHDAFRALVAGGSSDRSLAATPGEKPVE